MKDLHQKVAYLQGLTEGMELDTKEGKIIGEILATMEELVEYIYLLREEQVNLEDYVESIDSDLADLEDEVYEFYDEEDDDFIEVACPECGELVGFDAAILYDEDFTEVVCPVCDTVVFINDDDDEDFDEDEDEGED
jgi:ribosomal protein S27E